MLFPGELMVERLNSDLANTLGNLVNRTVSMTNKYFGGTVEDKGVVEDVDAELKAVVENASKAVDAKMADLRVADAITEIFNLFKRCKNILMRQLLGYSEKMNPRRIAFLQYFGI